MPSFVSVPHIVHGIEYEIRVIPTPNGYAVQTYREGKQIGWTYRASTETVFQFNMTAAQLTGEDALSGLVRIAKDDLDRGITK